MTAFRYLFSIAMFGFLYWTSTVMAAECPPGPFYCIDWGGGGGKTPIPKPPPSPFMPAESTQRIMEIKPNDGVDNDKLLKLLKNQKNYAPLSATDKSAITKSLGDKTKLMDTSTYYLAPKPNGKAVYFNGAEVQR